MLAPAMEPRNPSSCHVSFGNTFKREGVAYLALHLPVFAAKAALSPATDGRAATFAHYAWPPPITISARCL